MDSTDSGDRGSLRNFSVLLPSHLRIFSYLPTTRPLSSPEGPIGCFGRFKKIQWATQRQDT
jgi:hypothetical protein